MDKLANFVRSLAKNIQRSAKRRGSRVSVCRIEQVSCTISVRIRRHSLKLPQQNAVLKCVSTKHRARFGERQHILFSQHIEVLQPHAIEHNALYLYFVFSQLSAALGATIYKSTLLTDHDVHNLAAHVHFVEHSAGMWRRRPALGGVGLWVWVIGGLRFATTCAKFRLHAALVQVRLQKWVSAACPLNDYELLSQQTNIVERTYT